MTQLANELTEQQLATMAKESSRQENESLTVKSMEPVVVFHSTRTKNHSTCCKSFYQRRKLKNKGAIVVIVWNYLVTSLVFYLATRVPDYTPYFTACSFILPFAGWLADVHFGRYKVIQWSMWIMWIASMLATVSSVIAQMVNSWLLALSQINFICVSHYSFNRTWRILGKCDSVWTRPASRCFNN